MLTRTCVDYWGGRQSIFYLNSTVEKYALPSGKRARVVIVHDAPGDTFPSLLPAQ